MNRQSDVPLLAVVDALELVLLLSPPPLLEEDESEALDDDFCGVDAFLFL